MADTAVSKVEAIKAASNHLRGTIGEELSDGTPAFSPECQQLLRFHGIYQQDDRDVPHRAKARQGLDVDHICMVRVSIPGGDPTPEQYLAMDTLCDAVAERHLAHHLPAGHPVPLRSQGRPPLPARHPQPPPGDHPRRLRRRGPQHHVLPGAGRPGRRGRYAQEAARRCRSGLRHPRLLPAVARR